MFVWRLSQCGLVSGQADWVASWGTSGGLPEYPLLCVNDLFIDQAAIPANWQYYQWSYLSRMLSEILKQRI
jgi:hypothetical protein